MRIRWASLSFRARLTLVAAGAVALAVVAASAVTYVVVRGELYRELDRKLTNEAQAISSFPLRAEVGPDGRSYLDVRGPLFGATGVQAVKASGTVLLTYGERTALPVSDSVLAVAKGRSDRTFFSDTSVSGTRLRVLTVPARDFATGATYAVQIAGLLGDVDHTLGRITLFLVLIASGGVAIAIALGFFVSRAALAPVRRLTHATETVSRTGDLSERIDVNGSDELSRLAGSFNTMLAALEESTRAQRQLVADASHELRTPLTSLRTNIEVLARERELPEGERERLLHDVVEQLGEMTNLIAELIELARGEQHPADAEEVRLDLLTAAAVERAQRNRPGVVFRTDAEETVVHGVPVTIERALANLLDNAAKWSPPGGEVDVVVRGGEVTVRDHGPGIDEHDLPFVFDRFYRAPSARGMPGSGLGLAIVRQVARAHGGDVRAERAEGGGTRMRLRLDGAGRAGNGSGPPSDRAVLDPAAADD